ncbi:MAG: helicase-related protein, partial [Clostridia bacterium]
VLSKDVGFRDLGLLVLDEEQRFGVEHKEKLKDRYPLVNVLTLSATPIPRTLNMALSGVRDISMLETAPEGRLPVQTYVVGYSDALAVDAIERETARGGQTLILLNDISQLDKFAARLRTRLASNIRVITAHGQMASGELEDRIADFYDNKYDVLIATTIIENGIDLPDANTLIVINADHFGLSQLYQLRGRVGRRGVLAHAYFTLPENGALSTTAEKRLKALLDNTELGSGFKIALSDLSIRGAGNLLGAEQSGHIERVGYEMYLELLDEAVTELRTGKVATEQRDVEMKVDVPAYIRDGFIGGKDKLKIYQRISAVASVSGRDKLMSELKEVYGAVELPVENLINIALLKNLARGYDVSRVIINKNGAAVNFYDADIFKNEAVMRAVSQNSTSVVLTNTIPPSLIFDVNKLTPEQKLSRLLNFFGAING